MPTNHIRSVSGLLDRYLIGLDDEKLDDDWANALFTADAVVEFPMSRHSGGAGMAAWHRDALAKFAATQHLNSPAAVAVSGTRATLRANLISTHVHHSPNREQDPPGNAPQALFMTGTFVTGEARHTAEGWRFSRLSFRLVWASGGPRPES